MVKVAVLAVRRHNSQFVNTLQFGDAVAGNIEAVVYSICILIVCT